MADEALDTGDTGTQPDPVQQAKDNALGQMARSEDASAYIAERQDRQREDAGEQVNGEDRASRIREALSKARQETAEARQQNGLDQPDPQTTSISQSQYAETQWAEAQQQEATFEDERELARNEGKFQAVADG